MGIQYSEDFQDYVDIHVPYVYDRIIVADSGAAERGRDQWTVGWVPPPRKASSGELRRRDDVEIETEVNVAGHKVEAEAEKDEIEVEVEAPNGSDIEVGLDKRGRIGRPFRAVPRMGLAVADHRRADETEFEVELSDNELEVELEVAGVEVEVEAEKGKVEVGTGVGKRTILRRDDETEVEVKAAGTEAEVEVEVEKDEVEVEVETANGSKVEVELEQRDHETGLEVELDKDEVEAELKVAGVEAEAELEDGKLESGVERRDDETEVEVQVAGVEAEVELENGQPEIELETEDGHEVELKLRKRADEDQSGKPVWAAPFVGLSVPEGWWTPVREALLSYLRLQSEVSSSPQSKPRSPTKGKKPVLTYISMQMEPAAAGAKLRSEDHLALLRGLRKLEIDGVLGGVNLVRGNGSMEVWDERMKGIVESRVSLALKSRNCLAIQPDQILSLRRL